MNGLLAGMNAAQQVGPDLAGVSFPFTHVSVVSRAHAKINRKFALELLMLLISHTLNSICGSNPAHTLNSLQIIQFFHSLH